MDLSRRNLLRQIGAAAAGVAAIPALPDVAIGAALGDAESASRAAGLIRLDRNENALGPSPMAVATVYESLRSAVHRYPDLEAEPLRDALTRFHRIPADRLVLGCGSEDILRMAASAFLGPRSTLIVARPTFDVMEDHARRMGADVVPVALRHDYSHDLPAMLAAADAATGLVYICNPNNPTGTQTARREIEAFVLRLPKTARVVIDEAYHHYAAPSSEYASFIDRPMDDDRVIVTRSFSAIHGLAGLRVGYAVAAPGVARQLAAWRLPHGVNAVAARVAATAITDAEHVRRSIERNTDDRQEFYNQSHARMLKPIDSQTNFVMMNTGRPAAEVVEHFKRHNILITGAIAPFDTHIRVSVGTEADLAAFWRVWDLMPRLMSM